MEIIEQYIEGKTPGVCDDGLVINDKFIAVIDGVTSKGKLLWDGKKSGEYARLILSSELEKMDANIEACDAIEELNNALKNAYGEKYEIAANDVAEKIAATIIIFNKSKNEIWLFGDCQCLVNGVYYNDPKTMDETLAAVRSLYNHIEILKGKTKEEISANDMGREYILPLIKEGSRYANKPDSEYRYNVLDGFEIDSRKCVVIKVSPGDEIVMASDGYPHLKNTLKESEDALKKIIEEDPLCIELYKATKGLVPGNHSFDDRTYIRFTI